MTARRIMQALTVALLTALLLSVFSAPAVTAASPARCKVWNTDKLIGRNTLQRAVWAASPGDHLVVRGTCTGTTFIRKDIHIAGVRLAAASSDVRVRDSGPATLSSGSKRPTLVIDPAVGDLSIERGLTLRGGFVIGSIREWRSASFNTAHVAAMAECQIPGRDGGGKLQDAVSAASAGQQLGFLGSCVGQTRIDKALHIVGARIKASSFGCDKHGCWGPVRTDTGPPRIRSGGRRGAAIQVASHVDDLTIRAAAIRGGITITP